MLDILLSTFVYPGNSARRPDSLPGHDRDKSTLKVHLPSGGFNVVKFGDATDVKVGG